MKILILTNYFPPEIGGAAHLYYELSRYLTQKGHRVTVITGLPRYNVKERPRRYRRKLIMREDFDGVRTVRLWTPSFMRGSVVLRGLEHFLVPAILLLGGLFSRRYDVVLAYSPPLPMGLAAYIIGRVKGARFVLNIQDLFPKEAVLLGLLKNRPIIRSFEIIERFLYRKASRITVHSPGNQDHVLANGGGPGQVSVIYNWVDLDKVRPRAIENRFREEHGLNGKFVVSYAGTMGWAQDMNVIVEAARLLREHPDIVFLLVGDGPSKAGTEEHARRLGDEKITLLPTQPWSIYLEIIAASNISMINLHGNLTTPVVPSKLLNIMAAGRPVVASLPAGGDAQKIIEEAGCGICVDPDAPELLAEAILKLYDDRDLAVEMGHNGRTYAEQHFSMKIAGTKYEQLFNQVVSR